MNPSGSQGTQCVHQDFSSHHRHGYIPAECIHVRIPGHTGRILGSYLRDIFQPWHSSFVAMMQLENHMSQPCLTVLTCQIFGLFHFNWYDSLPMVVAISSKSLLHPFLHCSLWNIVGCVPSALDGSSPRGYSRKNLFSSIGWKTACLLSCHEIITWLNNIVGCTPSAPDGSSPRGYSRIFSGIDSKNDSFFTRLNFSSASLIFPYSSLPSRTIFGMFILLVSSAIIVFSSRYPHICDVINTINLFVIISWFWPLPMGSAVILQFLCPLVGYRFRSVRHVSAHVLLPGSYIRGEWGDAARCW
jgi:hypothetical protein